MDARKSSLSVLALLCFCLVSWTAAAQETDERHPASIAPQGAQLTFQTLDGDTQQVNPEEIWRIRATSTRDEPPGAIVIDYAFDRVYVNESLASVVEKVGGVRPLKKFTLPAGGPVYIVATKVTGVTRAIPHLSHPNAHAIIVSREGETQVRETREAINEALVE
jgi:aminopeptidase N